LRPYIFLGITYNKRGKDKLDIKDSIFLVALEEIIKSFDLVQIKENSKYYELIFEEKKAVFP
jgi:hypothetical protein